MCNLMNEKLQNSQQFTECLLKAKNDRQYNLKADEKQ